MYCKKFALGVFGVKSRAMNSSEFATLKMRITARLRKEGVTTSDTLASELNAPHSTVRVALEELSDEEVKVVRRLPFGLWILRKTTRKPPRCLKAFHLPKPPISFHGSSGDCTLFSRYHAHTFQRAAFLI